MESPARDADLLARARRGDRTAYGRLVEAHRTKLLTTIRFMMGKGLRLHADPEDVFQDAALAGMESVPRLEAKDIPGFRRWFLGIARNRILNARARARDKAVPKRNTPVPASRIAYQDPTKLESTVDSRGPEESFPQGANTVLRKLHELRSEQRLALILREYLEVPWTTVAFVLERPSEMAARQVYRRARRQMARKLGGPP